jgi:hypothetical protein
VKPTLTTFAAGILYLAIVYMLVRPGSNGATAIALFLSTFSDLVRGVTGQTYNSSSGTWSSGNG